PDYHQALGELSGAIQRMALLQALPDLPPGDDEDEDKLLAELAAKFTAEDLQLLYQIAINSRRDLDYAPDARAGFEMALLRMLAFRPQGLPPVAATSGGGAVVARATAAARPASALPRPAPAARTRVAVSAPAAESGWDAVVAALGLQGTARHFAANCVMLERKAGLVRLRLDPAGDSFRRPQIESRLAEALSQHYGEAIRLEITQADAPGEIFTPARRDAVAAEERQRAAEQSIDSDPAVRAMREVFGATVRPGSVKPLN
ncbi:MAG: DNA polymerase III subunit gamma/tau, partial [Proteobacteria bacterium]|nr:DNA polymerase III subunit gamma/tau [Pseudomonadota bacterium]